MVTNALKGGGEMVGLDFVKMCYIWKIYRKTAERIEQIKTMYGICDCERKRRIENARAYCNFLTKRVRQAISLVELSKLDKYIEKI